jgi:uncharacterized protein (TIGR01777 family)
MRILITGSSGLVGSALIPFLKKQGHDIHCLVRRQNDVDSTHHFWDPLNGILNINSVENFQVVIHLSGEKIPLRRWSKTTKKKILESRIKSTRLLVDKIKLLKVPPVLFISASGINYYGDRGQKVLTEKSPPGDGFLADVVKKWETSSFELKDSGIRTIYLRMGVILSEQGGALKKTRLPFKLGLGAILGKGTQYLPWISIDDIIAIVNYIINNESISGEVNAVAPQAITNSEYCQAIGRVLSRPVILRIPGFILRWIFGEMANQMLLLSSKVEPKVLTDHGYQFVHTHIDQALASALRNK